MLVAHRVAEDGHRYYLAAVGPPGQGRLPSVGEAPGRWVGGASAHLGLVGTVDGTELARLLAGRHPHRGDPLVVRRRDRVAGLDLLLAAPKSVSLTQGLAPPPLAAALADAHHRAVVAAVAFLEERACVVRQGPRQRARGAGLVAGAFLHRTSRADDPHLHTHVVTANVTAGPGGRWSALHTPPLFTELRTAGAVYQAVLRHEVAALGWRWQRAGERWELAGVPRVVIDAFSRRRAQLVARLSEEAREVGAAGPARQAARLTRSPKVGLVEHDALVASWTERATALDFAPPMPESERPLPAIAASAGLLDSLGDVFDRSSVLRAWCAGLADGAPLATLAEMADETLRSGGAVPLPTRAGLARRDGPDGPRPMFTTAAVERSRAALAAAPPAVVGGSRLERTDGLDRWRAAVQANGRTIVALAPSQVAAVDLEAATGIATASLSSRERHRLALRPGDALVVAGAERVSTKVLGELVAQARAAGAEVVLDGDLTRPMSYPNTFRSLAGQAPVVAPVPSTDGADGRATVPLGAGTLTVVTSASPARRTVVADWSAAVAAGRPAVMIARHHEEVAALASLAGDPDAAVLAGDPRSRGVESFVLGARAPLTGRGPRSAVHLYLVAGPARVLPVPFPDIADRPPSPTPSGLQVAALVRCVERTAAPWLVDALGPRPESPTGKERWREAAAAVVVYRQRWAVVDCQRALGDEPRGMAQRIDRRRVFEEVARALPERAAMVSMEGPGLVR